MIEKLPIRLVALWLLCLAGCGPSGCNPAADSTVLFTSDEAEDLRWPEDEWLNLDRDRQGPAGPRIVIHEPVPRESKGKSILETSSPTSFSVSFEANPAQVKMESLTVRAGRGILWKDLTPKLESYIEGNSIAAKALKIPEGRFVLKISIDDVNGQTTESRYRIHVRGG